MACGRAMTRAAARRLSAALSCLDEKPAQARQNAGASISRALHSVASRIGNESPALTQALEQSGKSKVKRSLTHQWKSSGESRAVTKALQRALSSGSAAAAENSETLLSTQEGSVRMTTQALDHSDNRGASFAAVTSEPSKPRKRRKSVKIEFEEHHIGSQLVAMSDAADAATEVGAIATKKVRKKKEAIVYNPAPPMRWLEVLDLIKEMRKGRNAAVDSCGAEQVGLDVPPRERRFAVLVAALLSSQTKDEITHAAVQRLSAAGLLTLEGILGASQEEVQRLIYPVGFHSRKAGYLKALVEILQRDHAGDIPASAQELMALPGLGPKMAHLIMNVAWGQTEGICVDTHVHRISNRLQWVSRGERGAAHVLTKDPEGTRGALEAWLPRDEWISINPLLVGFGQTICTPLRPKCGDCVANELCPAAFKEAASSPQVKVTLGVKGSSRKTKAVESAAASMSVVESHTEGRT